MPMNWKARILLFRGLFTPIIILMLIVLAGCVGYMVIEGYTFLESLYMTVITIGSVGFQEVKPLSDAGRVFTIILIVFNLAVFTYFITLLTRYLVDGELLRRYKKLKMETAIDALRDHVIICGFGRNGHESATVLKANNIPFVVVEEKNDRAKEDEILVPYFIKGDTTKDEILLSAGLRHAKAIIISLPNDADNVFIILIAKQYNPNIKVISRASNDNAVNKLRIAGANNVIMPDKIGGAHMATLVMLPDVVELLGLMSTRNNADFKIVEITATQSKVLGQMDLWSETGCTILGVRKTNGEYTLNPAPSYELQKDERLIVMGSDVQIEKTKGKLAN
jgi:voltage-gated potassium channel